MNNICMDANKNSILRFVLKLAVCFSIVFFCILTIGTIKSSAYETPFDVTYTELKCGTPVTFTVTQNSVNAGSTFKYQMLSVSGYNDGAFESIADPTRLCPSYVETNTFNFTFYASGSYSVTFYVMETTSAGQYYFTRKIVNFTITDPSYPAIETIADNIVAQCLAAGCSTEYDKALWLHDYLIANTSYDNSFTYCGAEGALARGKSTCEAYHRAYCMLLKRMSISYGRIENRTSLFHVWTNVKIDGEWCQVDCTWDDTDGSVGFTPYEEHNYFGVNTDIMNGRSTPNNIVDGQSAFSTSLANNYFIRSGVVHNYSDMYIPLIQTHIDNHETSFTIDVTNGFRNDWYYNENNVLFYPAAYQLSRETWSTSTGTSVTVAVTYSALKFTVNVTYPPGPADYTLSLSVPSGYSDTKISIDGVDYTGTYSGSAILTSLTNTSAKTAVMYKYDANGIPVGMYVWRLCWNGSNWSATALTGLENLISYHGFSIRFSGRAGIRFKSGISTAIKQQLKSAGVDGYTLVEIGSMYMNDANRASYPFVKGGEKVSTPGRTYYITNGVVKDSVFETAGGRDRFANVLTGLPSSNYATVLAFRAYVILQDSAGGQIIIYGPVVSRSIYTVAKQVIGRGDFPVGSAGYNYLNSIITTVEG